MAQEWIHLDDLLVAMQASIARAAERVAEVSERPSDIQYVVGECNISFPAQMQTEEIEGRPGERRTTARLPPPAETEASPVPEQYLARISFSLRPTVALRSEA